MNKARRVIAIIGLIAIALLYTVFFVLAFQGSPNSQSMLFTALAATIIVPVLLYLLGLIARNKAYFEEQRRKEMEAAQAQKNEELPQ